MRAALIGSGGPVLGREFTLDEPIVTIGRRDENTVVIKDPTVSRKHAEIRRDGDDYLIVDKNSTSGVMVNGQAISGERRLQDGDRIGIGTSAVFLVQLPPTESKTISFPQAQLGDQGRTQFITRTDLDDPRAIPATPPPAAQPPVPRPSETPSGFGQDSRPMRQAEPAAAPPLFAPPPASTSGPRPGDFSPPPSAPPPAPERGTAPAWSGGSQASSSPEVPVPQFAPPSFGTPASPPPPTFSAAPEVPRFGGNAPPPASFAPPPPTNTAGSNFGSSSGSPAFSPPPAAPSFAPPPPTGNSSPSVGLPSSAMAPQRSSRRGLVIGLTVLVLLLLIAAVVVFLLVSGSLGGS